MAGAQTSWDKFVSFFDRFIIVFLSHYAPKVFSW